MAPTEVPRIARLLVVEDEPLVRLVLAEGLRDAGFVVVEASNADEALAYLATGEPIDALFTDIRMPGISGVELATRVRAEHSATSIILTSADPGPLNFEQLGPFISKPYGIDAVVEAVRGALKRSPGDG